MRLTTRTDLGGYRAADGLRDVEVTKPFVLFCGPNGGGKTAALRMMRNAMGLWGERAGGTGVEGFGPGPVDVKVAAGDLGKLAAMRSRHGDRPEMPHGSPGVLDVAAMGWRGQRSWLFDSRFETLRLNTSNFEDGNFLDHATAMMGAKRSSHGEAIRHPWMQAMRFASGVGDARDPYDLPERLPANMRAIRDATFEPGPRPDERWLFLDEPETAVDLNALSTGLALMLERAGEGSLRVFCASHSPLFPAGLADHPKVQVVEVSPTPWLERQRVIFDMMRDPARMAPVGAKVLAGIRNEEALRKAEADASAAREALKDARSLSVKARAVLLAAADAPDGVLREYDGKPVDRMFEGMVNGLSRRPKLVRASPDGKGLCVTDEGRALATVARGLPTRGRPGKRKMANGVPTP